MPIAVRDLELSNEDAKVLERMHAHVMDEIASATILRRSQAYPSGGDFIQDLLHLHESLFSARSKRQLHWFLFSDCMEGFNFVSHSWTTRTLTHARLP